MNNPVKLVFGSLIGAGIGVAISKVIEQRQQPGLSTSLSMVNGSSNGNGPVDVSQMQEDFKGRLARARVAGAEAKARKEAELRELFRNKVNRPEALTELPADD